MESKNTAVFGLYKNSTQAECAIDHIVESRTVAGGFTYNDISVLLPDAQRSNEFAHEKHTKAPEQAATGVNTGSVIGGLLGLWSRLRGTVSESAEVLVGMGIPEGEAARYEGRVKDGAVLLTAHGDTSDQIAGH